MTLLSIVPNAHGKTILPGLNVETPVSQLGSKYGMRRCEMKG